MDDLKVGITGSRHGLSPAQDRCLDKLLALLHASGLWTEAHHGDCQGVDARFHDKVVALKVPRVVIHPPDVEVLRAHCQRRPLPPEVKVEVKTPLAYMARNSNIVQASHLLIACPKQPGVASGTGRTLAMGINRGQLVCVAIQASGLVMVTRPLLLGRDLGGELLAFARSPQQDG